MSAKTSLSHPIRVDWIAQDLPGNIGLTFAPGKHADSKYEGGRWERDLGLDLDELVARYHMRVQVCLLENDELTRLRIPTLIEEATRRGVRVLRLPIPDGGVLPNYEPVESLVEEILTAARAGQNVVIHCAGGLGRAGTIGGCALVRLGKPFVEVLDILVKARGPRCPETVSQRTFIQRFTGTPDLPAAGGA